MSALSGVPGKKFVPLFSVRPRYPDVAQVPLETHSTVVVMETETSLVSATSGCGPGLFCGAKLFQFLCFTPGTPARSVGASTADNPVVGSFTTIGFARVRSSDLWSEPKLIPML